MTDYLMITKTGNGIQLRNVTELTKLNSYSYFVNGVEIIFPVEIISIQEILSIDKSIGFKEIELEYGQTIKS